MVAATGAEDHGVQQAPFFVLTGARMPAVLVEVGFMSNADEEKQLASAEYQDKIAEAIVQGIAEFQTAVAPRRAVR
jgi:N-acetylmuramoyl-L-alanine amidase